MMKNIVTNTYSFERMIANGYAYVDKTGLLWRIANESMGNMFFISRPRRFGKSLMLSTLKAIFQGRRELFRNLEIDSMPFAWRKHPVLHFDMSAISATAVDGLRRSLCRLVAEAAFEQIVSKGYAVPYRALGGRIVGIGLNCNPDGDNRGIDEPVIRELRDVA